MAAAAQRDFRAGGDDGVGRPTITKRQTMLSNGKQPNLRPDILDCTFDEFLSLLAEGGKIVDVRHLQEQK